MIYSVEHWSSFFDDFSAIQAGIDMKTWTSFFEIFSAHPDLLKGFDKEPSIRHDLNEWARFLILFEAEYSKKKGFGEYVNVWEVSEVGNRELTNSAVLAWLLDCNGSHGQKDIFLKALLEAVDSHNARNFPKSCDLPTHYHTFKEYSHHEDQDATDGSQRSRVDIEVRAPNFFLLIEVKINADETGDQLARYNKLFEEQSCMGGVLFITPDGRQPADSELHSKIATVSWKTLSRAFMRQVEKMPRNSHGAITIQQFCEHAAKF
ncbi:MAG: PD-(D/E)XK nuclease family protein [Synergistaceae bacterium]|jgi:hypothetical protein|nr:PD-(D/E)XK nuclease family protein [Synergistaceae bacterium]